MSIVIKSNSKFTGIPLGASFEEFRVYKERVLADGGILISEESTANMFFTLKGLGIKENRVFSATSASWGVKLAGGNVVKLYNLFDPTGDLFVQKGVFPLSSVGGSSFYSDGTVNNKFTTVGAFSDSHNISIFSKFVKGTRPDSDGFLMDVHGGSLLGVDLIFGQTLQQLKARAYGTSGSVAGIPYATDFAASVTSSGLDVLVAGQVVGSDNSVTVNTTQNYNLSVANDFVGGKFGAEGYFLANIVCKNLTKTEVAAVSKYVADSFNS